MENGDIVSLLSILTELIGAEVVAMSDNTVTCSFTMDRDVYNAYKSIVASYGGEREREYCAVYEVCYYVWNT